MPNGDVSENFPISPSPNCVHKRTNGNHSPLRIHCIIGAGANIFVTRVAYTIALWGVSRWPEMSCVHDEDELSYAVPPRRQHPHTSPTFGDSIVKWTTNFIIIIIILVNQMIWYHLHANYKIWREWHAVARSLMYYSLHEIEKREEEEEKNEIPSIFCFRMHSVCASRVQSSCAIAHTNVATQPWNVRFWNF